MYMLISVTSFSMMSFLTKTGYKINPQLNQWDVAMSRAVISIIYMTLQVRINGVDITKFDGVGVYLFLTSITGIISYILLILAMNYISAAVSALIVYSNPIFVVFLAYLLLNEKVTKFDLISVVIVIGGCCIVFSGGSTSSGEDSLMKGYIIAILG
jgi:drug/metabolite transporter (DMT)-like permease